MEGRCTDGGQKSLFLGSFGAAQKQGYLVRAVSKDRGVGFVDGTQAVRAKCGLEPGGDLMLPFNDYASLDRAGISGVTGARWARCLPFQELTVFGVTRCRLRN